MQDFSEIRKGYFKGKLDGIRAERMRTGAFFDKAIKKELDFLHNLMPHSSVDEDFNKLLDNKLYQLKQRIEVYKRSVLVENRGESLRGFVRRINLLNSEMKSGAFKIFIEGEESEAHCKCMSSLKYILSKSALDYSRVGKARHDLTVLLRQGRCKLIFVYSKEFEKEYPLFKSQILDIGMTAGLMDHASSEWHDFVLWQLNF